MVDSLKKFQHRHAALITERSPFIPWWKTLGEYYSPAKGRFFSGDRNRANRSNARIINNKAVMAKGIFASGMMAGNTNPTLPWFNLKTHDPDLMKYEPVKVWLYKVEELIRDVLLGSNFYKVLPTGYEEFGVFGTNAFLIEEDFEDVIRCYPYTIGEYSLGLSARGKVDTIYSERQMTVGQVVQKFGKENVSKATLKLYNDSNVDAWVPIIHAVEPNDDRIPHLKDTKNMPWRSIYYEKGEERFLGISGYNEFPVIAPRASVTAGDVYGTSCPGMVALGDNKQLQMEERRKGQGIDKQVNPPLQAPATMKHSIISSLPGGISYYNGLAGAPKIESLYNVNLSLSDIKEDILMVGDRIDEAFYVNLFQRLINSDRRQTTAREVDAIEGEKMLMLGPVVGQTNEEQNDPSIGRTYAIMERGGLLPPPPPELEGKALKTEYISVLSQAQKMVGAGAIERVVGFVGGMAEADPSALDNLNTDKTINEYAQVVGAMPGIIRSEDEVKGIREMRAQEQQNLERMAMLAQGVDSAKTASETDTGEGSNLLEDLKRAGAA